MDKNDYEQCRDEANIGNPTTDEKYMWIIELASKSEIIEISTMKSGDETEKYISSKVVMMKKNGIWE